MRRYGWLCVLALVIACDDDAVDGPMTIDRSLFDASRARSLVDSGDYVASGADASTLEPPCPTIDVCTDSKPGLLYNVCIDGIASGAVSEPACLVDPNGVLYLAPLSSGQSVRNRGWTQSNNGTLSADDQSRCVAARAALLVDASTPPKCAGGA